MLRSLIETLFEEKRFRVTILTILVLCALLGNPAQSNAQDLRVSGMVFFWGIDIERNGLNSRRPLGSGFLVEDRGIAVSAKHVTSKLVIGESLYASVAGKNVWPVQISTSEVICATSERDICAVRLPLDALAGVKHGFKTACSTVDVGASVEALGFIGGADPLGGVINPDGKVVGQPIGQGLVPTDLDVVPTMSGGPVLDQHGLVVGVVKGADSSSPNLTFFTPILNLKPELSSLGVECINEAVQIDPLKERCEIGLAVVPYNANKQQFDRSSRCRVHNDFTWTAIGDHFFLNSSPLYSASQIRGTFHRLESTTPHARDVLLNGKSQMLSSVRVLAHADGGSSLRDRRCGNSITLNLRQYPLSCAKYVIQGYSE